MIWDKERCDGQLNHAGIVRRVSSVEPLKHLLWLLTDCVENRDLKCAALRIPGNEVFERSVGRRLLALRLFHQSYGIIAPEAVVLELRFRHRLRWMVLQNIERSEQSMKT